MKREGRQHRTWDVFQWRMGASRVPGGNTLRLTTDMEEENAAEVMDFDATILIACTDSGVFVHVWIICWLRYVGCVVLVVSRCVLPTDRV